MELTGAGEVEGGGREGEETTEGGEEETVIRPRDLELGEFLDPKFFSSSSPLSYGTIDFSWLWTKAASMTAPPTLHSKVAAMTCVRIRSVMR